MYLSKWALQSNRKLKMSLVHVPTDPARSHHIYNLKSKEYRAWIKYVNSLDISCSVYANYASKLKKLCKYSNEHCGAKLLWLKTTHEIAENLSTWYTNYDSRKSWFDMKVESWVEYDELRSESW